MRSWNPSGWPISCDSSRKRERESTTLNLPKAPIIYRNEVLVHLRGTVISGNLCPELAVTQPIECDAIYRRRRPPREVNEGCVRWYLTYRLSNCALDAVMAEWGMHVSDTTIIRWVFRNVPEYERRWYQRAKPVGSSWRVDKTYIRTRRKVAGNPVLPRLI